MCNQCVLSAPPPSPFCVVFKENGFVHIFVIILEHIVVHILFGNSSGLEKFVGLGMLTYSAFMEKKQEPEFNSVQ